MATGAGTGTGSSTAVEALRQVERLGRYQLLARLGQGGMGTIHLAVAGGLADFRKLLVVKELRRELTANDRFVEMFLAEAKLAARLDHPNIVQTLEAGQDGDRYFLAMEFLDGQPLIEILKRVDTARTVPTCLLIQILCDVLAGLHYAHELCDYDETPLHIVHRDVNPQNVFVTYHGHVKLVDFGIAKVIDSEMCTTAGVFKGKFPYAAPEQVNCQNVDRRADLFAVGVMLWEILAQRRFAPGHPTTESIDARLAGAEPRISALRPDIDPELAAICDHAMHVDPALRYRTAEDFRADLLDFLASRTEMAAPLGLAELMRREFAGERSAAHRVISAQIRKVMPDDELGDSLVRVLTRSSSPPGPPSVTGVPRVTGASLSQNDTSPARPSGVRRSELPQVTPTELTSITNAAKLRRSRRRRTTTVTVVALLAFGAAYLFVREIERTRVVAGPAAPGAAAGSEIATGAITQAVTTGAMPGAAQPPAAATALAASAALSAGEQGKLLGSPESQANDRRGAGRYGRPTEPIGASVASGRPRRRHGEPASPPAVSISSAAVSPTEPVADARGEERVGAPPASLTRAPVSSSRGARPLTVGDDLRVLRGQRRTRGTSLEDPFQ